MARNDTQIRHRTTEVSGVEVFYREAGDPEAGAIVLLPGHPSGAHAYDGLTQRLATGWHVIAPDYPGYGFSAAPKDAPWTFDWLAEITNGLLDTGHFALIEEVDTIATAIDELLTQVHGTQTPDSA